MEKPDSLIVAPDDHTVGSIESLISVLGGAYLLYDALKKEKKNIPEITAAGFMLFRGIKGFVKQYKMDTATTNRYYSKPSKPKDSNINIHARLIVKRPVNEVYNFWRHLGNLPLFMQHLNSVTVLSDTVSEWEVKLPGLGQTISWKAEIVAEQPNRFIGWRSVKGSVINNAGKVEFKDAGELGTLMHVVFSYQVPLGHAGEELVRLINPMFEKLVRHDIMGFKRYMETGTAQLLQQETVKVYL